MASGKVKWFDSKRGFGFILQESGQDIFVHWTCITGQGYKLLEEGELVNYEVIDSERGPKAQNVKRAAETAKRADQSVPRKTQHVPRASSARAS